MNKLEFLAAISNALGATFTDGSEDSDSARGRITMPDGVKFFIGTGGYSYRGKVHVSSSFPHYQHKADGSMRSMSQTDIMPSNADYFDGINASATKTPEQIAKDITRRFLPVYAPMWAKALAYVQRQADYWKQYNSLAAVAEEVLKPLDYRHATPCRVDYMGGDYCRVSVDNLDADKLRKLAAFLSTL